MEQPKIRPATDTAAVTELTPGIGPASFSRQSVDVAEGFPLTGAGRVLEETDSTAHDSSIQSAPDAALGLHWEPAGERSPAAAGRCAAYWRVRAVAALPGADQDRLLALLAALSAVHYVEHGLSSSPPAPGPVTVSSASARRRH
ncbi:hypothetical protein FJT64_026404 [Amphibalanus amphitrite]|uniref:Uncharacterized protein n=1 Tax=Amphibalanus amphitrite TaxID=1232801 RepID=A0A6A4W5P3_AMPAM|nr:hypothetical protein FJT64_026404 [Amphibalanus amphitrite]